MNWQPFIPFLLLGSIAGCWPYTPYPLKAKWLASWLGLLLFVILAKLGQLLLPVHSFDWKALFWEITVAIEGLITTSLIFPLLKRGFTIFKKLS